MATEANKVIYTMMRVSKYYDKKPVLKDISLSYFYGAKIGVLGLNGSGKSSLLRILAGADKEFNGQTILSPGYTIGFLEQEPRLDETKTVREIVEQGVQETVDLLEEYSRITEQFSRPMSEEEMNSLVERQGEVQEKLDDRDAWDLDSRLEMAMDALRCPSGETPVRVLSGGERRRVALCRLLLQKPDILLLDEPTNHLDAESVAWLEHHLKRYLGTIIAVTHDRYFLDNVAEWILELDRGEGIPWKGNYSSWLEQKQTRLKQEEKSESERQKTLQRELEWIRMSPKGRHAKSKARISSYETLLGQESEKRAKELEIYIPPGPRLGKVVIEADHVSKAYGDRLLIEGMSFSLPPGGIVGIIGPNGAGKTTLIDVVSGRLRPAAGSVLYRGRDITGWDPHRICRAGIGRTFQVARPFPEMTAAENVMTGLQFGKAGPKAGGDREERARELLKLVQLCHKADTPAKELTFSESRKLEVARALAAGPDLLLLDEIAAGLSPQAVGESAELVLKLREQGLTLLIIDHFLNLTARVSDRLVALHHGRVIAEGRPPAVLQSSAVTAAYFGGGRARDRKEEAHA
jgi:ATP-binding cassette ChvD family protein